MNDCYLSIRFVLLPIHPLDSEAPDEGYLSKYKNSRELRAETDPLTLTSLCLRAELPSPTRGEGTSCALRRAEAKFR